MMLSVSESREVSPAEDDIVPKNRKSMVEK